MGKTQGETEENHLSGGQEADRCGAESAVGESEACCHSAVVKKPTRSHRCTLSVDFAECLDEHAFFCETNPPTAWRLFAGYFSSRSCASTNSIPARRARIRRERPAASRLWAAAPTTRTRRTNHLYRQRIEAARGNRSGRNSFTGEGLYRISRSAPGRVADQNSASTENNPGSGPNEVQWQIPFDARESIGWCSRPRRRNQELLKSVLRRLGVI